MSSGSSFHANRSLSSHPLPSSFTFQRRPRCDRTRYSQADDSALGRVRSGDWDCKCFSLSDEEKELGVDASVILPFQILLNPEEWAPGYMPQAWE